MVKQNNFKRAALLGIALILALVIWGGSGSDVALSQQVESRLDSLEVDFRGLESRLNQIEAELRQVPGFESRGIPPRRPSDSGRNQPELNREQMFDRLATLVIELKQQVNKLEARVSKLEPR